MAGLTLRAGLLEIFMLISGCVNTVISKAQDDSSAVGWGHKYHSFNHPWTQSLFMFWGEAMCLAVFLFNRYAPRLRSGGEAPYKTKPLSFFQLFPPLLAIPATLDLLGSSIASIGLLYCSASVWQMFRGSIIIFTCILSMIFLKRRIPPYKWVAVGITICGLILVGVSSFMSSDNSSSSTKSDSGSGSGSSDDNGHSSSNSGGWQILIGIALILVGQLLSGIQMVVEEVLLKKRDYEPLQIVGMEGIFGSLEMTFIALPILFFIPGDNPSPFRQGSYDNALDAFLQMGNNIPLCFYCIISFFSIAFYNFFGLSVTQCLTAIHRCLIDACRSILVWAWELLTFYCISEDYGEAWTKWSWLQVGGFVLLILGTVIYNGILKLPWFKYEEEEKAEPEDGETTLATPSAVEMDKTGGECCATQDEEIKKPEGDQLAVSV
eukprot:m51a1_g1681 putative solute carrier family 35 member f6-like (435) ;mRNA; r:433334-435140